MDRQIIFKSDDIIVSVFEDGLVSYLNTENSCGETILPGQERLDIVTASSVLGVGEGKSYVVDILNNSMSEAGINQGDKVIVNTDKQANEGDIVLAVVNGETFLSYLHIDKEGKRWLVPANKQYKPVLINTYKTPILGVMSTIIKKASTSNARISAVLDKLCQDSLEQVSVGNVLSKFALLIPEDKDRQYALGKLHCLIDGKNGVDVLRILRAALSISLITTMPSYNALKEEFGNVMEKSQYYRDRDNIFYEDELKPIKDYLLQ